MISAPQYEPVTSIINLNKASYPKGREELKKGLQNPKPENKKPNQ